MVWKKIQIQWNLYSGNNPWDHRKCPLNIGDLLWRLQMQRLDEHFFRTKVFSSLNRGVLKERFYCSLRNFLHFLYSLPVLLIQCAGAWAVLLLSFENSICWLLSCFELFFSLNLNSCSSLEEPDLISLFSVVGDNKTVKILSRKQNCIHTERWKHSTW